MSNLSNSSSVVFTHCDVSKFFIGQKCKKRGITVRYFVEGDADGRAYYREYRTKHSDPISIDMWKKYWGYHHPYHQPESATCAEKTFLNKPSGDLLAIRCYLLQNNMTTDILDHLIPNLLKCYKFKFY